MHAIDNFTPITKMDHIDNKCIANYLILNT